MAGKRLLLVASLSLLAAGCGGVEEDPETAARLDALACPGVGASHFNLESTVAGLESFDAQVEGTVSGVLPPLKVWTVRGDELVVTDDVGTTGDAAVLTIVDGSGGEHRFCGGEGSVRRVSRRSDPLVDQDDLQARVLLRNVRTGPECGTPVEGDIGICFAN